MVFICSEFFLRTTWDKLRFFSQSFLGNFLLLLLVLRTAQDKDQENKRNEKRKICHIFLYALLTFEVWIARKKRHTHIESRIVFFLSLFSNELILLSLYPFALQTVWYICMHIYLRIHADKRIHIIADINYSVFMLFVRITQVKTF